jgi:translocation and assembly module TamB
MSARAARWSLCLAGAFVMTLILLLYTPPGLALAGRLAAPLTGGRIRIEQMGGFFPNHLHAARLEIADQTGVWLQIESVSLDWSALAMLRSHLAIDNVSAENVIVLRRPVPSRSTGERPRIDIGLLSLPRILLAPPVTGHLVSLSASGGLHYVSIHRMASNVVVTRLDNRDTYRIVGDISDDVAHGTAEIHEGSDGILGKLANLPGLGPVNLFARAMGDAAANSMAFQLSAGPLRADGHGTISLAAQTANLDATLAAPAMTPSPGFSWRTLSGEAHMHGRIDAPQLAVHVLVRDGTFKGVAAGALTLEMAGGAGRADLNGLAENIVLAGSHPDIMARAPLRLTADVNLKDRTRPVRFALTHPLVQLKGVARMAAPQNVSAELFLPSLGPFAALANMTVAGNATFRLELKKEDSHIQAALDGQLNTQGDAIAARLLGNAGLAANATMEGADLTASKVRLRGAAINAEMEGDLRQQKLNYRFELDLRDLSRLAKNIQGSLVLHGTASGPIDNSALSAAGDAVLATRGFARQRVNVAFKAEGLPRLGNAALTLDGRLDDAPLALHATLNGGKTRRAELNARWLSLDATAHVIIGAGNTLTGDARLALARLADITAFTGVELSGSAGGAIVFDPKGGKTGAAVTAGLTRLHSNMGELQSATLKGNVNDLPGKPELNLNLELHKIAAQGWSGDAQAGLSGPLNRLEIALASRLATPDGSQFNARATTSLDVPGGQLALTNLAGDWHGLALKLDKPTLLHFAHGIALDHLSAHLGKGMITASGTIAPELSLNAAVTGLRLDDFRSFAPQTGAQGTISAEMDLHGRLAAPVGTIKLHATDLRSAFSRGVSPAAIAISAQLMGDHAVLQASGDAGANAHLTLAGTAPLKATGVMALHAAGKADLSLLDAVTAASGRRLHGTLTLDGDVKGSLAKPLVTGHAELAGGEFQDYAQGIRIHDITAVLVADGKQLNLTQFRGQAGTGTLSANGHIDLLASGMPVDIRMNAQDARPIDNDLMSASLSGNMALQGHVSTGMTLTGKIEVTGGKINLPNNFPPQIAILNVRRRGQPPPPPPPKQSRIALNLAVDTTGPVFVRGRGVDAEMHGTVQVHGTIGAPVISGGLTMDRGTYSIVGQTLDFTTGRIYFYGTGLRGQLDPALDFAAQTVSGGVTAVLAVSGYASAPKIVLSSTPQLPQDEVVAHLLFQQSVKQLTPLQMASIAQAAASMGGIGGGFNPLASVRRTLGLDRLSVGSVQGGASGSQSQTTVEAGRYVTRNVYVGVKQNLSGGTQTQVQVDITRRLKAQATLSTFASAVPVQGNTLQDNGSSVGLSYQFEY